MKLYETHKEGVSCSTRFVELIMDDQAYPFSLVARDGDWIEIKDRVGKVYAGTINHNGETYLFVQE